MKEIISLLQELINKEKDPNVKKAMEMSMIQLQAINSFIGLRENGTTTKTENN